MSKIKNLRAVLGHRSVKFTQLIVFKNQVAYYLDDMMSEEELMDASAKQIIVQDLKYALIACNWSEIHPEVDFQTAYTKFIEKMPFSQDDFDSILEELFLLSAPIINQN